ncbi:MAG: hypothetical protein L0Z49_14365, partial [Actinobacteria bacterium]|nr:hypothetical protein [Actinomycetota bacterium]
PDLLNVADPRFILLGWAAGLVAVAGAVSLSRIVGRGFVWLTSAVGAALGLVAFAADDLWPARLAPVLVLVAALLARRQRPAGVLLFVAAAGYLLGAGAWGGPLLAATLAVALGGVTGEMVLGHWYLVDPRLPRSALNALAIVGVIGLCADGGAIYAVGRLNAGGPVTAYLALLVLSVLLMVGVLGALRQPAYSGVMAATGLSYLAVLTTLGAVFLGRALVAGIGPFSN